MIKYNLTETDRGLIISGVLSVGLDMETEVPLSRVTELEIYTQMKNIRDSMLTILKKQIDREENPCQESYVISAVNVLEMNED
jgi:hypothetical protein